MVDPRFTRSAADGRLLRADPRRHRTSPSWAACINYLLTQRQDPARVRAGTTPTRRSSSAGLQVRGRPLHAATTPSKRKYDAKSWGYELDEQGFAKVDTTHAAPALRAAADEAALLALHARDGEQHHAARRRTSSSRSARYIASTSRPTAPMTVDVRARLDAAQPGLADHPHRRPSCSCCWATSACRAAA